MIASPGSANLSKELAKPLFLSFLLYLFPTIAFKISWLEIGIKVWYSFSLEWKKTNPIKKSGFSPTDEAQKQDINSSLQAIICK